jgi:hypothetical protein
MLSGLPAGHIISLIGVGFVVPFAHILPIVKLFFSVFPPMQTLILIAHSTPPLLVPQAMRSTVYVLSFIVSFSLSYSFTLTLFLPFSAVDYPCIAWRLFIPTSYSFFLPP